MKQWSELTLHEQLCCTLSDAYKDAHGIRPRFMTMDAMSVEELNKQIEICVKVIEQNSKDQEDAEKDAAVKFEQHVTNTICMGARDRETALRWIMDASHADGDWDYFCYLNGLPYGYFRKSA
jgi:hypothetical protein